MSFAKYKKSAQSSASDITSRMKDKINQAKKDYSDPRFWKLASDKQGNAKATIRFLPAPPCDGDDGTPWIDYYSHSFQIGNRWFIENCPTSIGQECPVCESNNELWNSDTESGKKLASARKRKHNYVSNILVVNDPNNPENNGKCFLFRYGEKIFAKIKVLIQESTKENPEDPFCFFKGRNFILRQKKVDRFPNYDDSSFDSPTPAFKGDEAKMEEVYNNLYSLKEFLDPKNFKSYDELKKKFEQVKVSRGSQTIEEDDAELQGSEEAGEQASTTAAPAPTTTRPSFTPKAAKDVASPPVAKTPPPAKTPTPPQSGGNEDLDDFLNNLTS